MKKFLKVFGITLGSIVGLVLVVLVVALWLVFTPARLTSIVNRELPRFVTCEAKIERAELTFFSSFPRLGLKIDGLQLINPIEGAPCDTLLQCSHVTAAVDVKSFLKKDELWLSDIVLQEGTACLFTDAEGRTNFDIVKPSPDEEPADDSEGLVLGYIGLDQLAVENIRVRYVDRASPMEAVVGPLTGTVKAALRQDRIETAQVAFQPFDVTFTMDGTELVARGVELSLSGAGGLEEGLYKGTVETTFSSTETTLVYDGEQYLDNAALSLALSVENNHPTLSIEHGVLNINGLELAFGGDARLGLLPAGIETDLWYKFSDWPLDTLLALVPPSFEHYMKGISVDGKISSEGTAKGLYGENSMPVIDSRVVFDQGTVYYPAVFPYRLNGVSADVELHADLKDNASTWAKINTLAARAAHSSARVSGRVDRLPGDPHADITADIAADLVDARPFIPKDLPLVAEGRIAGRVKANATMSQLQRMALDKIKVSGNLQLTDLRATYDTILVVTPAANLDFSLPNTNPSDSRAGFSAVRLAAGRLTASMNERTCLQASGMRLAVETSDVRNESTTPAVVCDFAFSSLNAGMDDITADLVAPTGRLTLDPTAPGAPIQVKLSYNGGAMDAKMDDLSAIAERLDIDASIVYDDSRQDLLQQFSPIGAISMQGGVIHTPALNYPVEIPDLDMNFTTSLFDIARLRVKLDESDFSLSGSVDNIDSYIRGDSILRAEFDFNSPVTNVTQLLALTSGIGSEEEAPAQPADAPADEFDGPYMVPEGVDVTLHANIDKALWYSNKPEPNIFSDIKGDVRVKDGMLFVSPQISFSSPATNGEVMFRYETPSRDHLYAGVSLHLNNIEMQELLDFIPDVDSLMPMLRSFNGRGEFHLSGGGYMFSDYRFKLSTLRGAASVAATDLTLKDDEIYRRVAFLLKKKDEGVIRVDSLSAEFTVLRDKIDVYPFLLSMDQYKAVISGQHNLDMDFGYNISLVQSPLPFRMAVDVTSKKGKMKFKLARSKYPDFYRPNRRNVVESQEMELRALIRKSLTGKTEEEESGDK